MATIKQKKAISHILEGDSVSKAMRKAGYSKAVAKNPKKLTKALAFTEWLEKVGVTDELLSNKINEGLDANKIITSHTEPDREYPDYSVRHRYVETSLKLKGHLRDIPQNNTVIIPIYGGLSNKPDEVPVFRHNSDTQDISAQETD